MTKYALYLLILLTQIPLLGRSQNTPAHYDVVVVGATPAGISAAINAAKEGVKVVIIESTHHIGGLATGGLSDTDFQTYESLGGTWRDFMDRVVQHYKNAYGPDSDQFKASMDGAKFEPKVASLVFKKMLDEFSNRIDMVLSHELQYADTHLKSNGRVQLTGVRFEDLKSGQPRVFTGKVFIDATYEGDLMAKAGCEYRVGSEAQSEYGEPLAAEEANWHVQCYNFRPILTTNPDNRLSIPQPEGYNQYLKPLYDPLVDVIIADKDQDVSNYIQNDRLLPNQKADFNDRKGSIISLHVCNATDVWPEGNSQTRKLVFEDIKRYNQGFLFFLQNDPQLPDRIKESMRQWGLPQDEFVETGHWPPVVYVREGRRMLGEYVFTQHDAQPAKGSVRAPAHTDAIAIGDARLNSHGTYEPHQGTLKGVLSGLIRPWQVPYSVMLPKRVDGLLVPVAVSASHVGFGAIRMEPTWTALGQAAGLAAGQAIKKEVELREISVPELQIRLYELKGKTFYVSDIPPSSPYFVAAQYLGNRGYFQDLYQPEEATDWSQERIPDPTSFDRWKTAYPYHDVKPQKTMTKKLAESWLKKTGMTAEDLSRPYQEYSRGEFLNMMYTRLSY